MSNEHACAQRKNDFRGPSFFSYIEGEEDSNHRGVICEDTSPFIAHATAMQMAAKRDAKRIAQSKYVIRRG